jgi:hypothetical protein
MRPIALVLVVGALLCAWPLKAMYAPYDLEQVPVDRLVANLEVMAKERPKDPDCDLDFILNAARPTQIEAALCNCLGFGSKNRALVLGRG